MDSFTKEKRSWIMSRVKSSGNKSTELAMISVFKQHGVTGWRRNYSLYGKPDFVFPKQKVAVFVDGCFWHGHPSRCRLPSSNTEYWTAKIEKNKKRDRLTNKELKAMGWTPIRVWEHEINALKTIKKIQKAIARDSEQSKAF